LVESPPMPSKPPRIIPDHPKYWVPQLALDESRSPGDARPLNVWNGGV
jgi:hypothetical protein